MDPIQHLSVDSDANADLVKINGLAWMKYLGIRTSLVTMHAPWVGHTTAVGQKELTEFMMSQSPGTEHYVPMPGVSQEAVDTRQLRSTLIRLTEQTDAGIVVTS